MKIYYDSKFMFMMSNIVRYEFRFAVDKNNDAPCLSHVSVDKYETVLYERLTVHIQIM